jgi:hypothetical protein
MIRAARGACLAVLIPFIVFLACADEKPVNFTVYGSGAQLLAKSKAAVSGVMDFKTPQKLEYNFNGGVTRYFPASAELEYSFSGTVSEEIRRLFQLVFDTEDGSWVLPMGFEFAGAGSIQNAGFHYAIPVNSIGQFSITLLKPSSPPAAPSGGLPSLHIHSLELKERWYGYFHRTTDNREHFFSTPFVYASGGNTEPAYVIDPPREPGRMPSLTVDRAPEMPFSVFYADRRLQALPAAVPFHISGAFFTDKCFPLVISEPVRGFKLLYTAIPQFPLPLPADPGLILRWPIENWRDSRFEVFRWDRFPSLLIFDTADYDVQDRLFKRLAFFVEKAGFRGRLAPDAEIAGLHGWNAHDYKADDLAAFFEAARISNFTLLREERELQAVLAAEGIIRIEADRSISGGTGGIISLSRSSPDYLRSQFMAHEGFHGLFFIDEDFRNFSRTRWISLPRQDKAFITSFFDFQRYDIGDEYLMINEFMAHILQQPVSRASAYFGETLPRRVETSPWRRQALGEKDEKTNSWPALAAAFTREARAFSDYVNSRWGLSGGRVWLTVGM